MKVFSPPYRWAARPWANLYWCFWDLRHGLHRLWLWRDLVWNDYDHDWEPLAKMMVFKLRRMEPILRDGCHVSGERHAREVAICRALLERVIADEYLEEAKHSPDAYRRADAQAKADLDLFGKMFARHLRSWWD